MRSFVAALAAAGFVSCTGKLDVSLPGPVTEGQIEPVTVAASLAKVKGLLTGLPPTDAEVQAVQADPKAIVREHRQSLMIETEEQLQRLTQRMPQLYTARWDRALIDNMNSLLKKNVELGLLKAMPKDDIFVILN